MQMSRSVIMPITLPSLWITGTTPQSLSHMIIAAAARLVPGVQVFTSRVITSLTFIGYLPLCWSWGCHPDGVDTRTFSRQEQLPGPA